MGVDVAIHLDSTIIRAHRQASGAKKELKIRPRQFSRRSEHQNPYDDARPWMPRALRAHRRSEGRCPASDGLIKDLAADTAYDSDRLHKAIADKGAQAVIPNNPSRPRKYPLEKQL